MVIGSDPHDPSLELRRVVARLADVASRLDDTARGAVGDFLQWAADAAAVGAGRPRRPVPTLRAHALAAQAEVLGRDVLMENPAAGDELVERCRRLRRLL